MATGIISIAAHLLGMPLVSITLFWLNIVTYLVLWFLNVLRVIWFTSQFFSDMVDHKRGPGFFTSIAGSCVLGSQFVLISGNFLAATFLWILGIILWIGLPYTIFTAFTIKENKPTLDEGITGAWAACCCLHSVDRCPERPHSISLETALQLEVNFFALSMWLWGGMLYIWMISLIFYRYTFFKFSPSDLAPPYWINMGAARSGACSSGPW